MARARAVDRRLYLLVEITARRLHRRADARLRKEAGVTAAQSAVLFLLSRRGERRMGAISETLALGAPAVTGLVQRMEAIGLVARSADTSDRRGAVVSLTEVGRQAAFKADQVLRDINTELAEKLGEDDADALQDMLTRLNTEELG
ncbi:MAG: winged helix-turn-helix transcriptional regulator [Oceanicaulis sp.]|uniref:MarR family winged helix-turn-helix transcriptional regulator n=1 Tax=Glycocaulis sp. TaxID=1969725 RepID=UPI0025C0AB2F|nr:MarR family winged helix-turn-helix transcriptional regulator [Glycocaulis sp.]MCC5980607.1 winged helix-turn-helix transcriptional regulator [Oceanicaulis sp.]MCH8520338.1 MarR family winged helix-turn-helix transcriptional regulator [Glycocaulis sp.]